MTRREVVVNTLKHCGNEIPCSYDLTDIIRGKLVQFYGCTWETLSEATNDHLHWLWPQRVTMERTEDTEKDEFGTVWIKNSVTAHAGDWGGIRSVPLKEPSWGTYTFPDADSVERFSHVTREEYVLDDRYAICSMDGLFDLAWHVTGFESLLEYFLLEPKFVHELLDKALEYNLKLIRQLPTFINGIRFGEDWGQQTGLVMGGKIWRTFLKPRLKIMYEAARARGFDVFIHSCGNIMELFPDLIGMGVQAINPIQPEAMDIAYLKREYGRDVVLYGGLGSQSTIPNGTVSECIEEAKRCKEILSKDGGYIYGPAGAIPTDAPLENVIAIVEFAKNGYK